VNLNTIQTDAMPTAGVLHHPGTAMLKEAGMMAGSSRGQQNQRLAGVATHQHHFASQRMFGNNGSSKQMNHHGLMLSTSRPTPPGFRMA